MKEEWKRQLQQKMADYTESDIDLSWDEIEQALEKNAKTIPLWFHRFVAAAVVLLLAGIGYLALQRQTAHDTAPQHLTARTDEPAVPIPSPKQAPSTPSSRGKGLATSYLPKMTIEEACPAPEDQQTTDNTTDERTDKNEETDRSTDISTPKAPSSPQPHPTVIYPSDLRKKNSHNDKLTAKVYFSNATSGSSSHLFFTYKTAIPSNPTDPDPVIPPSPSDGKHDDGSNGFIVDPPITDDPKKSGGTESSPDGSHPEEQSEPQQYRTQQTNETTHHSQPVRFGLSLRYRLNERWSIESGLTYTRLSADFTKTVDDKSVTTNQHLNYIGIPVSASYLLWGSRYLNVYLSAGAMVEKMVSGSRTSNGVNNDVSIHPLQFSLNGAVGAEFCFSPFFSIYAEPGIGYWFDNGSTIPTYYQEHPLSFSISLGFRISPW